MPPRPFRLREIHAPELDRGPGPRLGRRDPRRRQACHWTGSGPHRDVPGFGAFPLADAPRQHRLPAGARGRVARGDARARGASPPSRAPLQVCRRPHPHPLWRDAATGCPGSRFGLRARHAAHGRAFRRPRRADARGALRRARAGVARYAKNRRLRNAQRPRGGASGRPRRAHGHAPGPHQKGHRREALSAPRPRRRTRRRHRRRNHAGAARGGRSRAERGERRCAGNGYRQRASC